MSALLSRNASSRPGITGTARVDRDIDRLLRRVGPGDIVVLDALDLDRITADALVDAGVAAVVNASPSISGRYPNLGPEVLVANGVTLIDDTGAEVFKKIKDGARIRLHDGGVYSGDRRLILGVERTDEEIHDLMHEAKSGLVAHLEAFAGNTIEFIRSESPLLIDGIGIPDIDVDMYRRHVVIVAEEPEFGRRPQGAQAVHQGVPAGAGRCRRRRRRPAQGRLPPAAHRRRPRPDQRRRAAMRCAGGAARRRRRARRGTRADPGPRRRGDDVPGRRVGRRPGAAARRSPRRLADRHRRPHARASRSSSTARASRATRRPS